MNKRKSKKLNSKIPNVSRASYLLASDSIPENIKEGRRCRIKGKTTSTKPSKPPIRKPKKTNRKECS